MSYSPRDILIHILDAKLEADFLTAIMLHKGGYSIAEIPDKELWLVDGKCFLKSDSYGLNIEVGDEEITAAVRTRKYVSVFISKNGEDRQIHFFVHKCTADAKNRNEEVIAEEVVQYMILKTVIALRLDTPEKAREYCQNNAG